MTMTILTMIMLIPTFNMLPDTPYAPGLSGGTIQSHHYIDMLLLHRVYVQIGVETNKGDSLRLWLNSVINMIVFFDNVWHKWCLADTGS